MSRGAVGTTEPRSLPRGRAGGLVIVASSLLIGCATDNAPVFVDDVVEEPVPITTVVVVPGTTSAPTTVPDPVVIERAWSPQNATAEINGMGAVAADVVLVDDRVVAAESFVVDDAGAFTLRVRIEDEGAHTVCVRDACSRVFTLAPDAESAAEIDAKIAEARPLAAALFDGEALFPEWTLDVAGPFSGTGGSTDVESKTITVYANRGRSVDEYVVTILHEWGHAVDAERMTSEERSRYQSARGIDPATPWRSAAAHTIEAWGGQPSEDFAEVLVALWTADTATPHQVRTIPDAGPPDQALFDLVTELVAS